MTSSSKIIDGLQICLKFHNTVYTVVPPAGGSGHEKSKLLIETEAPRQLYSGSGTCEIQLCTRNNGTMKKKERGKERGDKKGGKPRERSIQVFQVARIRYIRRYLRVLTYPLKRKLDRHKSGVPPSIRNIDLNHKDRPRYIPLSGPDLLYSFSCLPSVGALDPLPLSFPLFFGNHLSIHLFRARGFYATCGGRGRGRGRDTSRRERP